MRDQRRKNVRRQLAKEGIEITESSIQARVIRIEQRHARVASEKKAYAEATGLKPITTKYVRSQLRQRNLPITPDTIKAHWAFLANRRERIANEAKLGIPRKNKVYWMPDSYIACMLRRSGTPCSPENINSRRQSLIEERAQKALPIAERVKLYERKYRASEKGKAARELARDSLTDYYVRSALDLPAIHCPPELVELKRAQLKLNRKLKAIHEQRI